MRFTSLDPLFAPHSIAVIGDSGHEGGIVWTVVKRMVTAGFKGQIVPVVPDCREVWGIRSCKDLASLAAKVDVAVICLALSDIESVLVELGHKGIRLLVCLALAETEIQADELVDEQRIAALAHDWDMIVVGPKSLGLVNTVEGVNASVCLPRVRPGTIAFFSQSASLTQGILDMAQDDLGFSKCISLGKGDRISESEIMTFLGDDPETSVIAGYMEAAGDGPHFLRAAQDVTKKKPVIIVRPGNTPRGATAALFHRDSMLGFARTYTTVFKQTGILNPPDIPSFLALLQGFSRQPLPHGNNVAILTNSTYWGTLAANAAAVCGFDLCDIQGQPEHDTLEKMSESGTRHHAVCIQDEGTLAWQRVFDQVRDNAQIHALLVIIAPLPGMDMEVILPSLVKCLGSIRKTVVICTPQGDLTPQCRQMLTSHSLPWYHELQQAIDTLCAMRDYFQWQQKPYPVEVCYRRDRPRIRQIIEEARRAGTLTLQGMEIQPLLMAYELPVGEMKLARTAKSAAKMARKMGFPVELKLASPQWERIGALQRLYVEDNKGVYDAFWEITEGVRRMWPEVCISGCLVQKTVASTTQAVCIRIVRDPQFGPLLSLCFDSGVEGRERKAGYRLLPLSLEDAHDIIREVWAGPRLGDAGEEPSARLASLEDVLLTVSQLAMDCPEVIELEVCPVYVDHHAAMINDARVVLTPGDF